MSGAVRVLYTLCELKRTELISPQDVLLIREHISKQHPQVMLMISLAEQSCNFQDIRFYIEAYLSSVGETGEAPVEEYSPETTSMIAKAEKDSSPYGSVLLYRKQTRQATDDSSEDFRINI